MQSRGRTRRLLSNVWINRLFNFLVGTNSARRWLAGNYWICTGDQKVVDMGCGTGETFDFLPDTIKYIGFDISEKCIKTAQKRADKRARFILGSYDEFDGKGKDNPLNMADLVLCNGLLHHLDDEDALKMLTLAKSIMSPTGRVVCVEPTFLSHQRWMSRFIISKDRGRKVRTEQEWKELISKVFTSFSTSIVTGLIRIPYEHIIIEC